MTPVCDHCRRRPAALEVPIVLARVLDHSVRTYSGATSTTIETTTRLEFAGDDRTRLCHICERRRLVVRFLVGPLLATAGFAVVWVLGSRWADGALPRISLPGLPNGDIVPLLIMAAGLGSVWLGLVWTFFSTRDELAVRAYHERVTAAGSAEAYTVSASNLDHRGRLAILPAKDWRNILRQREREEARRVAKRLAREKRWQAKRQRGGSGAE